MTPFLIISNCQVQPLKHGLAQLCRGAEIESVGIHVIPPAERQKVLADLVARRKAFKFVLTVPLSEDYGPLSSARISDAFFPTPVFSITNLTFRGVHPDITYIGGLSQRAPGPIGDYHSLIALLSFLMGLTPEQAVMLYCDAVYSRMGFYEEFAESLAELKRRDEETTIPIGDDLEHLVRQGLSFLSHNHPTSFVLAPYVNKIAAWLAERGHVSLTGLHIQPSEMINFLANSTIFPIYPEIVAHHDLAYEGSYVFRTPTYGDLPAKTFSLLEFVRGEHEAFRHADGKSLRDSYPGNLLMMKFGENKEFQALVQSLVQGVSTNVAAK